MPHSLPAPGSPAERAAFARLQATLADRFQAFRQDTNAPYTTVVVPSQSVDPLELAKIAGVAHYEERSLFNLMLLRFPRLRLVYVTSKRIDPDIVDYYLHQMRGVPTSHARRRLVLLDADDASPRALSEKILERPRLLGRIRDAVPDAERAHLVVFNSTPLERTLAVGLGLPLFGCDPDLVHWGSKTGSRRAFRQAGLRFADGEEGLRDSEELVAALADLWARQPDLRRAVVKLNEGFSGEGNAILDLDALGPPADSALDRQAQIRAGLPHLRFEAPGLEWPDYSKQFDRMGGVCEAWIEGIRKTSPSAQVRINPLGEVQAVSTHDQVLGGPSGQVFLGACFPADERYRIAVQEQARQVGAVLAEQGVIGRFAVDFLAVWDHPDGEPTLWAVEINLRQGGTTHPFNTLKFITDGEYDINRGTFTTTQGRERAYFATDVLSAPEYKGILPVDLLDRLVETGLHFRADETGVVFHLMGCLSEFGKVGCTAIAPTVDEAKLLFQRVEAELDLLAGRTSGKL